jgi:quercetin dioxygenase-like cupin family protein
MKKTLLCALAAFATPAWAQAPVIDNERVTVRDITLEQGKTGPAIQHAGDYVVIYVNGGQVRAADGKTAAHADGSAIFGHGGSTSDTATGGALHEVVVDLKDAPSNTVPNTTGLPPAFPRDGSKLVLETPKVRVWNYTWLPGKPTPMHFHNTEVVVTYLHDGDVASTTPDGKKTVNHRKAGDIVFNVANRSHSEELVKGEQAGIMLELK